MSWTPVEYDHSSSESGADVANVCDDAGKYMVPPTVMENTNMNGCEVGGMNHSRTTLPGNPVARSTTLAGSEDRRLPSTDTVKFPVVPLHTYVPPASLIVMSSGR